MPHFKRNKTRKKKKNLLNWKERSKEEKEEKKDTAGKSNTEKTNDREELVLTALRVSNWQTQCAQYVINVSIGNVFHIIIKCTCLKKKKIPVSDFSKQTFPLTWLWLILNSHNILNYVAVVNASNYTAWWQ